MSIEFNNFLSTLNGLREQFIPFRVDFMDRNDFKEFAMNLSNKNSGWSDICVTGYFSEGMREEFEKIARRSKLRLVCIKFEHKSGRGTRDLQALKKLSKVESERENAGVEIKISDMVHARLFIVFNRHPQMASGELVLGSFDFNKEGIAGERFDAGIYTQNPDLVKSAIKFFEEVWNDDSSKPLDEAFPKFS